VSITKQLFSNSILFTALTAWLFAQLLKVVFVYFSKNQVDLTRLLGSGGMPSSHSALVVALSVATGRRCGFESVEFAIAIVFAFVVMYDAAGVRRAAGKQARVINTIIKEMYDTGKLPEEKLKELIGHTPVEVIAGAIVGIATAVVI